MARLDGQVALVTGAARRGSIGRAIVAAFAGEGADVAINDFMREEEAEEIAQKVRALGAHDGDRGLGEKERFFEVYPDLLFIVLFGDLLEGLMMTSPCVVHQNIETTKLFRRFSYDSTTLCDL